MGERSRDAGSGADSGSMAELLAVATGARPDADTELINRAYAVAAGIHAGQRRKSGDPYITHPVAVATILAKAGADDATLCAALVHDTPERPGYRPDKLRQELGASIADVVATVADLDAGLVVGQPGGMPGGSGVSALPDARVLMIKLADRLHNMRTAAPLPRATQVSKSKDTLEVFVPLADTLNLKAISTELRDLATQTLSLYAGGRATPTARLLATASALLPAATRARWRDEWTGELAILPTRRQRTVFALRTLAGIPRLAATLRRPRRPHNSP
jgi:(p)ppGpp synthase/HD superfamily hydrolase